MATVNLTRGLTYFPHLNIVPLPPPTYLYRTSAGAYPRLSWDYGKRDLLFMPANYNDYIYTYSIGASAWTLLTIESGSSISGIRGFEYDLSRDIILATYSTSFYQIDLKTMASTLIGTFSNIDTNLYAIAHTCTDRNASGNDDYFFYISSSRLHRFNITTSTEDDFTNSYASNIYDIFWIPDADPLVLYAFQKGSDYNHFNILKIDWSNTAASWVTVASEVNVGNSTAAHIPIYKSTGDIRAQAVTDGRYIYIHDCTYEPNDTLEKTTVWKVDPTTISSNSFIEPYCYFNLNGNSVRTTFGAHKLGGVSFLTYLSHGANTFENSTFEMVMAL